MELDLRGQGRVFYRLAQSEPSYRRGAVVNNRRSTRASINTGKNGEKIAKDRIGLAMTMDP
jgi:hypothetical protein